MIESPKKAQEKAQENKRFIVYGMPRTGTTFLYRTLSQHPQIFVSYRKESLFFSVNFDKGLDWYRELFEGAQPGEVIADINPMYFMDDRSLERVLDFDPNVRVVLGVREPVEFAISLYRNIIAHGHKTPSIVETMRSYDWPLTPQNDLRICLDEGFIQRRIQELCEAFGDKLLLYDFRHFDESPLPVLTAIEEFLGLERHFSDDNVENIKINASGRRDILGVNKLIANQRILETAYRIMPKFAIRKIRTAIERVSVPGEQKKSAGASTKHVSEAERETLEEYLAADRDFYHSLFSEKPVLIGSEAGARA